MRKRIPGERFIEKPDKNMSVLLRVLSPYVRQSGDEWRGKWKLGNRKLLDYLIVFIAKGEGFFRVGDKEFKVKNNDLIWIPPDTVHYMEGYSEKMHCIYIHFDLIYDPERSHWDACIPEGTLDLSEFSDVMHPVMSPELPVVNDLCGLVPVYDNSAIYELMTRICRDHRHFRSSIMSLSGMLLQLLEVIFCQVLSAGNGVRYSINIQKLIRAAAFIEEHIFEKFDPARLSKQFALSESHFRKLFREYYGISPREMYCRSKIRKACEMLVYTDLSVSEIGFQLGFATVHNFSRAFKNAVSVSPGEFRKGKVAQIASELISIV